MYVNELTGLPDYKLDHIPYHIAITHRIKTSLPAFEIAPRRRAMNTIDPFKVVELLEAGYSYLDISEELDITHSSVWMAKKKHAKLIQSPERA